MIGDITKFLVCPVCLEGSMYIDTTDTIQTYSEEFELEDVDKLIDGVIGQYWVFACVKCGATQKYNFKDIDRLARKELSRRVVTMKATGELGRAINIRAALPVSNSTRV